MTLFEIIIALLILSLVLLGMVNLFVASKRIMTHGLARLSGAELARLFLDNQSDLEVRQDTWASSHLFNLSCPGSSQSVDNRTYTGSYSISTVVPYSQIRKVMVNITWNEFNQ